MTDEMKQEVVLKGNAAAPGITIGKAYLFKKAVPRVEEWDVDGVGVEAEIARLGRAIDRSEKELTKIHAFAQQKLGDRKGKIFEAQIMVLQDEVLLDSIRGRIRKELKNAEFIVDDEISKYAKIMLTSPDEYMHERAHDVDDLKFRIIRNLQQDKLLSKFESSMIVVSHSLTPADTVILSRNNVLGYATDLGGVTSHAALLSCSLKIPAVVGLGHISQSVSTGDTMILDGYSGTIILHPTEERIREYNAKREHFLEFEAQLTGLKEFPATTLDGHDIELSANIEFQEEIEYVVVQGSRGIGLYRTESLLLERGDFPSEEEQFLEYKKVVDRIYPHRVIMRTFDVGGDKVAPEMAEEDNPFLGWRGIRMMLDRNDLFKDQLRAMLRASSRKNLSIMFPMITTVGELLRACAIVDEVKAELTAAGTKFDAGVKIGVMIEVPAAAMVIDRIVSIADFVSIGTNDLTQYLLAVDRNNALVSGLYDEFEPSILITLKQVIDATHKQKKWVGICGDMASNPVAVPLLLGLGFDELSVIPSLVPEIKKIIRTLTYKDTRTLAQTALKAKRGSEVRECLLLFMQKKCPDIPITE